MIALLSNGITSEALKNALSKYINTLSSAAVVVTADNEYKERNYHVPREINELKEFGLSVDTFDLDTQDATGDASDNIKGADKVGPKTASSLLSEFGNLENIILNAEAIKKPSIRESIIRNADRLRTNYKLIKLEGAVPLPFTMEELPYTYDGITTNEVLKGIGVK